MAERTQEGGEPPADPATGQPAESRRPTRFVRSRDWMARNADKKDRTGGDQPRPEAPDKAAGEQSVTARKARASSDLWATHEGPEPGQARTPAGPGVLGPDVAGAGTDGAAAGSPPELPRRKPRVSHRRDPGQAKPVAAADAGRLTAEPLTEPIPVIRLSPTGEPLPPDGVDQGIPAPDGMPVTAAVQAPDQAAASSPIQQAPVQQAPVEQAPAEQAPVQQPPVEQAPAEQAPGGEAPAAGVAAVSVTPGMPLGHSMRSRGKAGLRARVARGLADAPPPPAGPEVPERQDAGQPASQPAQEEAAAQRVSEQRAQQSAARRAADEVVVQRAAAVLARKSSPARTRRRVGLAAAVVVGGVAAGFAFLGSGGHQNHRASSNPGPTTVVVNRDHAAAWVASQVSPTTVVSCDPVTCVLIESHGFPASRVRTLGPGKGNPLVSNVVVATPAVRHQFGAQLTSVYAPGLLATFGSGSRQVDIQLVAPHGVTAYRAALNDDLQNRRQSGAGLSGSNRIQAPSTPRNELARGQVDSRLMITLALMASLHPVHLVTFGDGGPDLDSAPLRSAELSLSGSAQKKAMLTFLRQQQPPYQPAHVTTKPMGRNQTLLIIEFTAPSPVGLFH